LSDAPRLTQKFAREATTILTQGVIDITADQFDESAGKQVIVGATNWHKKCRILDKHTATYEFTDVAEGCDYADHTQLEYAYKQLIRGNS